VKKLKDNAEFLMEQVEKWCGEKYELKTHRIFSIPKKEITPSNGVKTTRKQKKSDVGWN